MAKELTEVADILEARIEAINALCEPSELRPVVEAQLRSVLGDAISALRESVQNVTAEIVKVSRTALSGVPANGAAVIEGDAEPITCWAGHAGVGTIRTIEQLAHDIEAFGAGMGASEPESAEQLAWHEKAKAARCALLVHANTLLSERAVWETSSREWQKASNANYENFVAVQEENAALLALRDERLTTALDEQNATLLNALRWAYFRNNATVYTDEDGDIGVSLSFGPPKDIECLTETERETFQEDAPDVADMPSLCERLTDNARGDDACVPRPTTAAPLPSGEAAVYTRAENLLLGLHKVVSDLGPYFDKPLTEESMPRWLALDSAQKAVAAYFGVPAKEAGEDGR